jgi:hypothetical protein
MRVKRQHVLIQLSTKKRIDLGVKFKNKPYIRRLETLGPLALSLSIECNQPT